VEDTRFSKESVSVASIMSLITTVQLRSGKGAKFSDLLCDPLSTTLAAETGDLEGHEAVDCRERTSTSTYTSSRMS